MCKLERLNSCISSEKLKSFYVTFRPVYIRLPHLQFYIKMLESNGTNSYLCNGTINDFTTNISLNDVVTCRKNWSSIINLIYLRQMLFSGQWTFDFSLGILENYVVYVFKLRRSVLICKLDEKIKLRNQSWKY